MQIPGLAGYIHLLEPDATATILAEATPVAAKNLFWLMQKNIVLTDLPTMFKRPAASQSLMPLKTSSLLLEPTPLSDTVAKQLYHS
jgi:hypothetical protein